MDDNDNPTQVEEQTHWEQAIFRCFVQCARLNVADESIRSGVSGEPDILCLLDGSAYAFELAELIDQEYREKSENAIESHRILEQAPRTLPLEDRESLAREYGRHHIHVAFHDDAVMRTRAPAAAALFKWLAQRKPPAGAVTGLNLPPEIRSVIRRVEVRPQAPFLMPHLDFTQRVQAPDLRIVEKKVQRAPYVTKHPVDLLLHAEQYTGPGDAWIGYYGQQIGDMIEGSQFRRVWVFNPNERASEQYKVWLQYVNTAWRPM